MYGCAVLKRRGARLARGEQGDREVVAWCIVEGQNECKSECPRMRRRDDAVPIEGHAARLGRPAASRVCSSKLVAVCKTERNHRAPIQCQKCVTLLESPDATASCMHDSSCLVEVGKQGRLADSHTRLTASSLSRINTVMDCSRLHIILTPDQLCPGQAQLNSDPNTRVLIISWSRRPRTVRILLARLLA